MKHAYRTFTALLLTAGMTLSLCGCGEQAESGSVSSQTTPTSSATSKPATVPSVSIHDVDRNKTAGSFAFGEKHAAAILSNGTAIAAGDNTFHQCDVYGWTDLVQIEAGSNFTVGLKSDGTVVATGPKDNNRCDVYAWEDIVSVRAGGLHTIGLKADGTVVATGRTEEGQCAVDNWKEIIQVDAGYTHTVGLKADGTVVATGKNNYGECDVTGWTDIVQVAAGNGLTAGVKSDGTVVYAGKMDAQNGILGWTDMAMVAVGSQRVEGVKKDGGSTSFGRNVCAVFAYGQMSAAIYTDGTVKPMGSFKGTLLNDLRSWKGVRVVGTDGSVLPGTSPAGNRVMTQVPKKPEAAALTASGQCGEQVTWEYYAKENVLFISGQGNMWDYEMNQAPWAAYLVKSRSGARQISTIVVEEGVTSIGSHAFYVIRNACVLQVFLPDGLLRIGESAFQNQDEMRWCPLPDTIEVIEERAFSNCEIWGGEIPRSLATLGGGAFAGSGIQVVRLPGAVVTVPDGAFEDCKHLQVAEMAEGIVEIGSSAFIDCLQLSRVNLPQTLVTMGLDAFRNCDSLTAIQIPDSVSSMNRSFYLCSKLAKVNIPASLVELEGLTFGGCDAMESIHIPGTVLRIDNQAFSGCDRLTKVTSDRAGTAAQLLAIQKGFVFEVVE